MLRRKTVEVPQNVDWSERALPEIAFKREHRGQDYNSTSSAGIDYYLKRVRQIRKENAAYLFAKLAANNGVVRGYHGTSQSAAEFIQSGGFLDLQNEEGGTGVSMWDAVVPLEAKKFAADRAESQGEAGTGTIIVMEMTNPKPDKLGRLEWVGRAENTRVLDVIPAEKFEEYLSSIGAAAMQQTAELVAS